jgi:hypothetical protein
VLLAHSPVAGLIKRAPSPNASAGARLLRPQHPAAPAWPCPNAATKRRWLSHAALLWSPEPRPLPQSVQRRCFSQAARTLDRGPDRVQTRPQTTSQHATTSEPSSRKHRRTITTPAILRLRMLSYRRPFRFDPAISRRLRIPVVARLFEICSSVTPPLWSLHARRQFRVIITH